MSRNIFSSLKEIYSIRTLVSTRVNLGNQYLKLSTKSNNKPGKQEPKMDLIKTNPYFSKYESKLKAVYKERPDEFIANLKNRQPEKVGDLPEEFKSRMSDSLTKKRTLNSIMKLDLVKDLPPEEIKNIWTIYMEEKSRSAGMLTVEEYSNLIERSQEFKTFLFAMPRSEGYEFILAQWANNECHFTPLINYQAHGENAPSVMSLIYFDDIIETKKVVLEMAEIDLQHLKLEEAKLLIHQMKLYYLNAKENDEKYALLTCFCKKPNEFKHMSLIKQLENDNIKVEQFKKETTKVEETQKEEVMKEQSSEKQ